MSRLIAATAAARAAAISLDIARPRLAIRAVNSLALLNAQNTYQQARNNLVQAQAARFADTTALFQALGGGWWNRGAAISPAAAAAQDRKGPMAGLDGPR